MISIPTLLAVGAAFWIVAVTPGPANLSNAAVAMRYGRKTSMIYGAGLSLALILWGLVAATGMGALLQTSASALFVMKLLGGCYLLYLAWQTGKSAAKPREAIVAVSGTGRWFWRGLILNLSNPKTVIAWMAALSMGLDSQGTVLSVVLSTIVCMVVAILNNMMYSLIFSTGGMMAVYRRWCRWIDGISAAIFSIAGLALIRSAFAR